MSAVRLSLRIVASTNLKMSDTESANTKFLVLLHSLPSQTLQLLEGAYCRTAMIKTRVYESHKLFREGRASVNEYARCGLVAFFGIQGFVHYKFIPEGYAINKGMCVEILRRPRDTVRWKRPEKWVRSSWIHLHHNAPAHWSLVVKSTLRSTM